VIVADQQTNITFFVTDRGILVIVADHGMLRVVADSKFHCFSHFTLHFFTSNYLHVIYMHDSEGLISPGKTCRNPALHAGAAPMRGNANIFC